MWPAALFFKFKNLRIWEFRNEPAAQGFFSFLNF
jgi:hypothetical protein